MAAVAVVAADSAVDSLAANGSSLDDHSDSPEPPVPLGQGSA